MTDYRPFEKFIELASKPLPSGWESRTLYLLFHPPRAGAARPPEGKILTIAEIEAIGYDFKTLTRLS